MSRHVLIIGGGIAGLATAFYLQKRARASGAAVRYTLVEQDGRLGGKIVTDRPDGFVVEGGPDSFINQKPHGLQLCRDLGIEDELLPSNDATYRTRLVRDGQLLPYPDGFRLAVPTRLWPFLRSTLLSAAGKARMGCDLFIPPNRSGRDESLAEFIRRRLGAGALDRIAGPIMAGIFVSDPERMSVQCTFPMFVELERRYGSLIRGILAARRGTTRAPRKRAAVQSVFTSLRGGMGRIVEAIAAQLGDPVLTGCRALSLRQMLDGFEVEVQGREGRTILSGSDLVLAVPAYEAARLVDPFHVRLAGALKRIRYVSSATVSLAFAGADAAAAPAGGGFGFVVPRGERSRLLAFTWSSRKFDHRAPADRHLVRAFVGGSRHEELALLPDAALVRLVRDELAELLGLRADPLGAWLYRWPAGNPQFDVGHLDRVAEMERLAAETPGLHLAGSAYRGLGIPDCVKSAQAVVDRILGAP